MQPDGIGWRRTNAAKETKLEQRGRVRQNARCSREIPDGRARKMTMSCSRRAFREFLLHRVRMRVGIGETQRTGRCGDGLLDGDNEQTLQRQHRSRPQ